MEAIKFENDKFMDSTGVVHKKELLSDKLDKIDKEQELLNTKIIYDSGSNSNGSWIKFADGTMICRRTSINYVPVAQQNSNLFYGYLDLGDFAQPFIEPPTLICWGGNNNDCFALEPYDVVTITNTNAGGVYPIAFHQHVDPYQVVVHYIAMGFWKKLT